MPIKTFAAFAQNVMEAAAAGADNISLATDNTTICLWPVANRPTAAQMDGATIKLVSDLETATGGSIYNGGTSFVTIQLGFNSGTNGRIMIRSVGGSSFNVPSAPAGTAVDFLMVRMDGLTPDSSDHVICYHDAGVTPNGVDPIPIDTPNGVIQFGQVG